MRAWGRAADPDTGQLKWQLVQTDANGFNDEVYVVALAQVLKLNLGESPFFADSGIPQQQTIMTQIFPDFYVTQTQQRYAGFFATLTVAKVPADDANGVPYPNYRFNVLTKAGTIITGTIPQ